MKREEFIFKGKEAVDIYYYRWQVPQEIEIKGIFLILHGMAEHSFRYDEFAKFLSRHGYVVYAEDHRGHGKTGKSLDKMGYFGKGGWNLLINDTYQLINIIKSNHKDIPLILFGHSMGSIIARTCIYEYGLEFDAVILSGISNGKSGFFRKTSFFIAKIVAFIKGGKEKSPFMEKMIFFNYNKKFSKDTKVEWLTKDKEKKQEYIDDELCGFVCTASFFVDMLDGINRNAKKSNVKRVPSDLPMYIFSGTMDPVGNYGRDVVGTYKLYKDLAGLENVKLKLYENGRHEMLNEVNKNEVYKDVLGWLEDIV